MNNELGKKCRR